MFQQAFHLRTAALDPGAASDLGTELLLLHASKHLSAFLRGSEWELKELHLKQQYPRSSLKRSASKKPVIAGHLNSNYD